MKTPDVRGPGATRPPHGAPQAAPGFDDALKAAGVEQTPRPDRPSRPAPTPQDSPPPIPPDPPKPPDLPDPVGP